MARFEVRLATEADVDSVASILAEYLRLELRANWLGSAERLREDGFGRRFDLFVAQIPGDELVGFVAFAPDYDLHACVRGARVLDLYVRSPWRGRGVAPVLLAHAARAISERGGCYMKGSALPSAAAIDLYGRCAVPFHGPEFTLGARAFRQLASLAGSDPREIAANLPPVEWNFVD